MKFARIAYLIAGIYGILSVPPLYFCEQFIGSTSPPPITHPEFFYGFVGCVTAWQVVFLIISRDPQKYMALLPVTWLEKFPFTIACIFLYLQSRLSLTMLCAGLFDGVLGTMFVIAYFQLKAAKQ